MSKPSPQPQSEAGAGAADIPGENERPTVQVEAARPAPKPLGRVATEKIPTSAADRADTAIRDPLVGLHLGEYVILSRLGRGGMGLVYEGVQPVIQKRVAIKVLQVDSRGRSEETAKLVAEARAANAVRHRGIVDVFSFGSLPDGRPYIVMELLEGDPLDALIARDAPMRLHTVMAILIDVLEALSAAHAAGVIHRDLKPGNLFLVRAPDGTRYMKVLDFGLAKQTVVHNGVAGETDSSTIIGTPRFMAPEQVTCDPVDPRTDLYSLGCIAFAMLTGRAPYEGLTPYEVMKLHVSGPIPAPSSYAPDVPEELDELIRQLLAKSPRDRPASAEVVRRQLTNVRQRLVEAATMVSPPPRELISAMEASRPELTTERRPRQPLPHRAAVTPAPERDPFREEGKTEPSRKLPKFEVEEEPDEAEGEEESDPSKRGTELEVPRAAKRASGTWMTVLAGIIFLGVLVAAWFTIFAPPELMPGPPALTPARAAEPIAPARTAPVEPTPTDPGPAPQVDSRSTADSAEVHPTPAQPARLKAPAQRPARTPKAARPAPETQAPPTTKSAGITKDQLLDRIDTYKAQFHRRVSSGATYNPAGLPVLNQLGSSVLQAESAEELRQLSRDLDGWAAANLR